MTYEQTESSTEGGDPVELYEFLGSGSVPAFRYTSAEQDVTFDAGGGPELYEAIPIKRTDIKARGDGQPPELTITFPTDTTLSQRYVFQIPPRGLELNIYRLHQTDNFAIRFWNGKIFSWAVKDRLVNMRVPNNLLGRIREEIPKIRYQTQCNNVLYDAVCSVLRDGSSGPIPHKIAPTALNIISGDGRTLTVSTVGTWPNNHGDAGEIIHDDTGESRLILTQVGTTITILHPFSVDVDTTDIMTLQTGCDHSLDHCVNKFGAQRNFNGMPFLIPQALNPTQTGE